MSNNDETVEVAPIIKDIDNFNTWYDERILSLGTKIEDKDIFVRMREIMRMAWRECANRKNDDITSLIKSYEVHLKEIETLKAEKDSLFHDFQLLSAKLAAAEKAAKR